MQGSCGLDGKPFTACFFDVYMVFVVALMVALVILFNMQEIFSKETYMIVKNPGKENMEIITRKGNVIEKYKTSEDQQASGRKGRMVGVAYQLESGDIIYIPE
ncbi:DUF2149 domain-containing protein [Chlorobium sp.]|uniref:DUF2149 domain-containing protein n=1 Tax=Chlorobium sp. TaxID=1095 RepID=UPI002F411BA1